MPLHPAIVILPICLGLGLLALDGYGLLSREATRRWSLVTHLGLLGAAIAASASGEAEVARIPIDEQLRPVITAHETWGTRVSFLVGAALALRVLTWRRASAWRRWALAACSLVLAGGLLYTAHLGGRAVFEHGAGVQVSGPAQGM